MNMQLDPDLTVKTDLAFVTGWGQSDTHALLIDGKPNPHKSAGTPYAGISGRDLVALIKTPQKCPKEKAQWLIPSTYCEHDARSHAVQRTKGAFWFLALDIDCNNLDLDYVLETVRAVTGECGVLIYSTASATADNHKWRVLIPLAYLVARRG